ncbi:MAG: aldo/keto reductase [Planctomycetota bacterium]|jgi:alcohol dehydrogenase (NADP+)
MKTLEFADALPMLGLGTWKSTPGEVGSAVRTALELGYRHIDCAAIYGNEAEIGAALAGCERDQLWITSKLWNNAHAAADVEPALRKTLSDLRLDYLDLYLIHWPVVLRKECVVPETGADMLSLEQVPILETWRAMEALVDKGLCRNIGVSNFSIAKLDALLGSARIAPAMNQIELHPYLQQPAMLEFCAAHRIGLTAYSPLGSPDRPETMKAEDEPVLLEDAAVASIAARHDCSPAQVLIAWAIARGTAVIPKSVNRTRLEQNLAAASIALSETDMAELAALDRARRYVDGSFWEREGGPYTVANLWD